MGEGVVTSPFLEKEYVSEFRLSQHLDLGLSRIAFGEELDIPPNSNLSPGREDSGELLFSIPPARKGDSQPGGKGQRGGRGGHVRARKEGVLISYKQSDLLAAVHYLQFLKDVFPSMISPGFRNNRKPSCWGRMEGTTVSLNRLRIPARVPERGGGGDSAKLPDGLMGAGERSGVTVTSERPV